MCIHSYEEVYRKENCNNSFCKGEENSLNAVALVVLQIVPIYERTARTFASSDLNCAKFCRQSFQQAS